MKRKRIRKWLELDEEDCKWIDEHYPGISYSALVMVLMKKFRDVHTLLPSDLAELGAKELKKEIEG